ncbi:hypothetical protein RAA17_20970 [Komagataeibacter rhaeticus]|nr:hypothetical protein [Komagataeibacter rhaeticus]
MIWIGICLLGVIALLPALLSFRRTTLLRDERETALCPASGPTCRTGT